MSSNHKIHIYKQKLPFYFIPALIFFGLIIFSIFTLFGLFIAIALGTIAIGAYLIRLLTPSSKLKGNRVEADGRTIVLDKEEYEVIEKKK